MATWTGVAEPKLEAPTALEWLRVALRGVVFVTGMVILMLLFWLARLVEWPFRTRKFSNFIIWLACVMSCWLMGLRVEVEGMPMEAGGARVCNHSSWMDIFVLRAASQIFFVAKAEVRGWPVLGFIADQTGTMFIERKRTEAKRQEAMFAKRLSQRHRLCFFPEGTSSDGLRVLPFKSTLFSAFMSDQLPGEMWVQPVTVFYRPAPHLAAHFYGWWGNIGFGEHFLAVLAKSTGGTARVMFHAPVKARDLGDRKALSLHCEAEVRRGHDAQIALHGIEVPPASDAS